MDNKQQAYWKAGADLSMPFFLHRMNSEGRVHAPQIPAATLPMFGFLFLVSGQVLVDVQQKPVLLHSGELLLIPAHTPFAIKYYQDSRGYSGGFRELFLKDASHPILRNTKFSVHNFIYEDAQFMGQIFQRMLEQFPDGDVSYLKSSLDYILAHLKADVQEEESQVTARFIDMVFDRGRPICNVSDYARELQISADLLNHHVRRYSNHSAIEWVSISRMALARDLLINTDLSMAAISEEIGLLDPSYFSRFFRKREGMTPFEFRKRHAKK